MLEFIELNPQGSEATACLFGLHGLGASGYDFLPEENDQLPFGLSEQLQLRFVFPHAPRRRITCASYSEMRGWFDIIDITSNRTSDAVGINQASEQVQQLIQREIDRGIPSDKIVLLGFSQGGVIALHAGLRSKHKIGGIIALSSWLAHPEGLVQTSHKLNLATPIFLAHGTDDAMIPLSWARESLATLLNLGCCASLTEYQMGHSLCELELKDLNSWMSHLLGPVGTV